MSHKVNLLMTRVTKTIYRQDIDRDYHLATFWGEWTEKDNGPFSHGKQHVLGLLSKYSQQRRGH